MTLDQSVADLLQEPELRDAASEEHCERDQNEERHLANLVQIRRAETVRDQRRNGVPLDPAAVAVRTQDLDVAAGKLGRFEDCLTAAAARRAHEIAGSARNRDPRDLLEPECELRGGERGLLGAQAKAVAGVLDIGSTDDLAAD